MTTEQQRISKRNHKLAVEYFKFNGEWFQGCHLHHINPDWKDNDIERYIQWNPRDLMVLTQGEHTTIHNRFIDRKGENNGMYGKHQSDEAKKKISSKMSGKKTHLGIHHSPESRIKCGADKKGKHWKVVDGVRVWF